MIRKHLRIVQQAASQAQVGVGSTSGAPVKVDFGLTQRKREVAYLKSARLHVALNVPGAGWALNWGVRLARYGVDNPSTRRRSNVIQLRQYDADGYTYYAAADRASPSPLLNWHWDEGFEPVFLENPYTMGDLAVTLNAGTFIILLDWFFEIWEEEVKEGEYEKLKLRYGNLG